MTNTQRKFLKFELCAQYLKGRLTMNVRSLSLTAVAAAIGFAGALGWAGGAIFGAAIFFVICAIGKGAFHGGFMRRGGVGFHLRENLWVCVGHIAGFADVLFQVV